MPNCTKEIEKNITTIKIFTDSLLFKANRDALYHTYIDEGGMFGIASVCISEKKINKLEHHVYAGKLSHYGLRNYIRKMLVSFLYQGYSMSLCLGTKLKIK